MSDEERPQKKGFLGRLFRRGGEAGEEPREPDAAGEAPEGDRGPDEAPADAAPEPEVRAPEAAAEETWPEEEVPEERAPEADEGGLFRRLRRGLAKTRHGLVHRVDRALFGKKEIDAETLEALEEALVTSDLGVETSLRLIEEIQEKVSRRELTSPQALREHLQTAILELLVADPDPYRLGPDRPRVIMVVGVNGVGKTTTIGKIAAQFRDRGHKVVLAAADTFRAAAIEQLQIWGERTESAVVRHQHGSDPAAVAFDAVESARARGADLVIVDTAGRLHTKVNLMEELRKVQRVVGKALPGAPHEVLLVLDANNGQNAVSQARTFHQALGVDSIALTKLDGTARGGVIVGICHELGIPVKFIGIGEQVDDLRPFEPRAFVEALFQGEPGSRE